MPREEDAEEEDAVDDDEEEEEEEEEEATVKDVDVVDVVDTIGKGRISGLFKMRFVASSPFATCNIRPLPAAVTLTPIRTASQSKERLIGLQYNKPIRIEFI
jgi:hypothetical protein